MTIPPRWGEGWDKRLEVAVERILWVGNEESVQELITKALSGSHFQLLTASNEREALRQCRLFQPDLIILDTALGGLVPRLHQLTDAPLIVLGRADAQGAEVSLLDSGADYYLTHPLGELELGARIRALLRRANSIRVGHSSGVVRR